MSFVHFYRNCYNISAHFRAFLHFFKNNKCNGVLVPVRNQLLFVVTSNDFVTFKISLTSNCNETITKKNG